MPIFTGQDWLASLYSEPPRWWLWMEEMVNQLMRKLNFRRLPPTDQKLRLMGRAGKGKWVTLMRFKDSEQRGIDLADLDSDGLLEIALTLWQLDGSWVHVGKFVAGEWWLGREKLPDGFSPNSGLVGNFRYRGLKWVLWRDEKRPLCCCNSEAQTVASPFTVESKLSVCSKKSLPGKAFIGKERRFILKRLLV